MKEHHFASLVDFQLVIVLTNSLEVEYPSKKHEKAVYAELCRALRRRSYVGILKGGAKELFRAYHEMQGL